MSKVSDPNCIPVVVLKNCELELSYIPAEFWRSLVFQIVGRFYRFYLYLRMLRKDQWLKAMVLLLSFFLWLVKSKELVNNRTVDHLEKCNPFYSQYGFRSSWLLADLLTVVSDRFFFLSWWCTHLRIKTELTITWIKKMIIQVDTNYKLYYVNQESKDSKKYIVSNKM